MTIINFYLEDDTIVTYVVDKNSIFRLHNKNQLYESTQEFDFNKLHDIYANDINKQ